MVIWRAGIANQTRDPPYALLQVGIVGSQTILAGCDQHGQKGQEFLIINFVWRSAEDLFRRLMKAGHPAIGSLPHFERIKPQSQDLLLVQHLLHTQGKTRLTNLADPGSKKPPSKRS